MSRRPLMPGEGSIPSDQIRIPVSANVSESREGDLPGSSQAELLADSYRETVVRIWPECEERASFDLVPAAPADSESPAALFGPECESVFILSGTHALGRPSTRKEDAWTEGELRTRLDADGIDWVPAALTSSTRQWVEVGAVVKNIDLPRALSFARLFDQPALLRWDANGLAPIPARDGTGLERGAPVPVQLVPAMTGCPLRGGQDDVCTMSGGPWTKGAIEAAGNWKAHRALLLEVFGCGVCGGEGGGGPIRLVEMFTPTRTRGWLPGGYLRYADLRREIS